MAITAQYKCDDREYTVEVIDTDGEDVTIACDVFPMVFVRHVGWCEQPTMTVNKKWIYNVRDTEAAELAAEEHKALKIVLDVTAPKPDVYDSRIDRRERLLDFLRDEPLTKDEAHEIFEELAEIDVSLQIHPSDTCNDYIGAAWDKNLEEVKF